MDKETILQAMKEIFDASREEESEWGMPMRSALYSLAQKLGIETEYSRKAEPEWYH